MKKIGIIIIVLSGLTITNAQSQIISQKSEAKRIYVKRSGYPEIKLHSLQESTSRMRDGYLISDEDGMKLEGTVKTRGGTKELSLNGRKLDVASNGDFSIEVPLKMGANTFHLKAKDVDGEEGRYDVFVNRIRKEKRVALVIGNSNYEHAARLTNPINDAQSMADCLKGLNFDVSMHINLDFKGMRLALRDFSDQVEEADVVWIYYAGHGIQSNNLNYLIPVDAELKKETDVPLEAFAVNQFTKTLEANGADGLKIIVLDACRNNPFKKWARGGAEGLAKIDTPTGTIVAFSTSPNSYAADGDGKNGLYTGELIKQMLVPQRIVDVFRKTRLAVENKSNKLQSPWEMGQLRGIFYLLPQVAPQGASRD